MCIDPDDMAQDRQIILFYLSCARWLSFAMTTSRFLWYRSLRPEFFYFLVLGKFLGKPSVGGGNKNKNKIQKFPESE